MNTKPKSKPLLVQHRQNDAIVESQTYLRSKARIINQLNQINSTNQETYKKMEELQTTFYNEFNYLKANLESLMKTND